MQGSLQGNGFAAGFSAVNFFEQRKRLFPSAEAFHPICGRAILDDNMLCEVKPWMDANQLARRNLSDGERFEVAVQLKDALLEKGREKMSEGGGDKKSEAAKSGLSVTDTPGMSDEPKHDTRQEIASNLGWSTGKVAQAEVVRREAPEQWEEVKAGAVPFLAVVFSSQIAREGAELQRIEAERAAARKRATQFGGEGTVPLNSKEPGESLDAVAASLGISRDRWYKIRTVFEKAQSGDPEAQELMKAEVIFSLAVSPPRGHEKSPSREGRGLASCIFNHAGECRSVSSGFKRCCNHSIRRPLAVAVFSCRAISPQV